MKKFNEKQILNLIVTKLGTNNMEPCFGKDDISLLSLKNFDIGLNKDNFLAITCDMLVEHTDIPPTMTFSQISRKSVVACISDLVSKGIKPVSALISLGIPTSLVASDISELIDGFALASKEFGFDIIGGDINESNEIVIDCCMIGFSNHMNIPRRNGAQKGDYVVVSGPFGYSSSGLKILLEKSTSPDNVFQKKAINSVLNPSPQYKFGSIISPYLSSSIDSSDGLALSLYELSTESSVDILIEESRIPVPLKLQEFSSINNIELKDLIFYGGEEYQIIGTISKQNLTKVNEIIKKYDISFYVIGRVIEGDGKVLVVSSNGCKEQLMRKGYSHFS